MKKKLISKDASRYKFQRNITEITVNSNNNDNDKVTQSVIVSLRKVMYNIYKQDKNYNINLQQQVSVRGIVNT